MSPFLAFRLYVCEAIIHFLLQDFCLAGIWIAPFAFLFASLGDVSKETAAAFIAVAGAIVMLPIGIAMDFLRVHKLLWAILFLICALTLFIAAIMSYPSIERAISKNGSWWAYILFSINIGIYISIILSVIITLILRISRVRRKY